MHYINGTFAKDITRQAVIDLFYQFAANKKNMLVSSLPGESWEFEKHVAKMTHVYKLLENENDCMDGLMYLEMYENKKKVYNKNQEIFNSFKISTAQCCEKFNLSEKIYTCSYNYKTMNFKKEPHKDWNLFRWHDYCGLPTKRIIDDIHFPQNKSVFIFTFSTSWRRKDSIPKELKDLAEKYGEAEALCSYFSFLAKEHGYKSLFKCEYKSSKTPMVIFALTNDKKLCSPKIIDLYADKLTKGRKTMSHKLDDLAPEIKEQVYTCLKDNVEDGVILSKYGISKKRLGSYKAHITMGHK